MQVNKEGATDIEDTCCCCSNKELKHERNSDMLEDSSLVKCYCALGKETYSSRLYRPPVTCYGNHNNHEWVPDAFQPRFLNWKIAKIVATSSLDWQIVPLRYDAIVSVH